MSRDTSVARDVPVTQRSHGKGRWKCAARSLLMAPRMRWSMIVALAPLAGIACGGSTALVPAPGAIDDASGDVAAQEAATDADDCPADPAAAIGASCSTLGQTCGDCRTAPSFCNEIVCIGGVWTNVEVPPQGPPLDAGSLDPRCPPMWNEAICSQACSTPGLTCSYPAAGDGLYCFGIDAGEAGAASGTWECGI